MLRNPDFSELSLIVDAAVQAQGHLDVFLDRPGHARLPLPRASVVNNFI